MTSSCSYTKRTHFFIQILKREKITRENRLKNKNPQTQIKNKIISIECFCFLLRTFIEVGFFFFQLVNTILNSFSNCFFSLKEEKETEFWINFTVCYILILTLRVHTLLFIYFFKIFVFYGIFCNNGIFSARKLLHTLNSMNCYIKYIIACFTITIVINVYNIYI